MSKMIDPNSCTLSTPVYAPCPRLPLSEDELHLTDDELDRLCDIALRDLQAPSPTSARRVDARTRAIK
jgi:hypothetical protein